MMKLKARYLDKKKNLSSIEDVSSPHSISEAESLQAKEMMAAEIEFLGLINVLSVKDIEGAYGSITPNKKLASRIDVTQRARVPTQITITGSPYKCVRTHYDSSIGYDVIDRWAHTCSKEEFEEKIDRAIWGQVGSDMLTIGWNGVKAADNTDIEAHPDLQDVNIGWLQKLRDTAPDRVLKSASVSAGQSFLDNAVKQALNLLDSSQRKCKKLRVIFDSSALFELITSQAKTTNEKIIAELYLARVTNTGKICGIPILEAPGFPAGKLLVTSPDNLSIYIQNVRRFITDKPQDNIIYHYLTQAESYVIEDSSRCGFIEEVVIEDSE